MTIREYAAGDEREIRALYGAVGWTNYEKNPAMLRAAYLHSLCALVAWEENALVGAIRAVGDGASIVYIQDVLVRPDFQRRGIGTALVQSVLGRYKAVYQIGLMTDDLPRTKAFYRSLGFLDAADLGCRMFVKIRP